jgi:hypothetical protein
MIGELKKLWPLLTICASRSCGKKEADSRFSEAKRHITDDINSILAILEMKEA